MSRVEGVLAKAKNKYGDFLILRKNEQYAKGHARVCSNLKYETPVTEIMEQGDYSLFIDIGAAFGYYSLIASHYADVVLAFEPHPLRYGLLRMNTVEKIPDIITFDKYVGEGEAFSGRRAMSSVGNKRGNRQTPVYAETIPLSKILEDYRSFFNKGNCIIKIDVEGNELDVIDSAGDLNQYGNSLIWLVERHPWNVTKEELYERFIPYGYEAEPIFGQQKAKYITEIFKFEM